MSTASTRPASSVDKVQETLRTFGRGSLADSFGDMIFYRNLEPLDKHLPHLKVALRNVGLNSDRKPRKQDLDYARIAVWFAEEAQRLRGAGQELAELLYVGDTLFNDGNAYRNMARVSGWQGSCFIATDAPGKEPSVSLDDDNIYFANRWSMMGNWVEWLRNELGMQLDERTVVIVDIDKTALGAKGRNDKVIDRARIEGAYRTMSNLLGPTFAGGEFETYYNELNKSKYHVLTEDNQDYLAYVCLVISTGLMGFTEIVDQVATAALENFDQFARLVEMRMMISPSVSEAFREAHDAVMFGIRNGDPTPFKRFRRQEFICTVELMGNLDERASVAELLAGEITLTQEVMELVDWLKQRGCLAVCLSDKPDEASCPHPHVSPDLPPIHRAQTHRVGTSIAAQLASLG